MKTMQLKCSIPTEQSMLALGKNFAQNCDRGVIFLHGELGAGKTTFVRGFLRGLGFSGTVKSPTYTLVEPYRLADKEVFHFDLYRLQDARELENIGIKEYFSEEAICLIEWAERGYPFLPTPDLDCEFKILAQGREVFCKAFTEVGNKVLLNLKIN